MSTPALVSRPLVLGVPTSRIPQLTPLTRAAFIAMFATVGFTWAYLVVSYPELPAAVPVRFASDRAVIFQWKNPLLAMVPVAIQIALAGMIAAVVLLLVWRPSTRRQSTGFDQSARGMLLVAEAVALIGLVWLLVQALAAVQLVGLWRRGSSFGHLYTLALVTASVLSMTIGARTMLLMSALRQPASVTSAPAPARFFYRDPQNPVLFVPASSGFGWSLNFGRPMAIVLMAAMLGFGVIAPWYIASNILLGYWR